eukprot:674438_1
MVYTYYDYLENYYEDYYESYYYDIYNNGSNATYNGTYPPYEYISPYKMEYITPPLFTLSVACALFSVFIVMLFSYRTYQSRRKNKITVYLSLCCEFMHLGMTVIDPISYYAWYLNYSPLWSVVTDLIWEIFWLLSKISLYSIFIYRYYLIFEATPGTTNRQKYSIFGSFTVAMVLQCAMLLLYMALYYELVELSDDHSSKRIWLTACWVFLAIDAVLIGILTYLLCYSVLKLVFRIHNMAKDSALARTTSVPSKTGSTVLYNASSTETGGDIDKSTKNEIQLSDVINHNTEKTMEHSGTGGSGENRSQSQSLSHQEQRLSKWQNTATKVAVTMIVSMASSFIYQVLFNVAHELDNRDLMWMECTWAVDAVINMLCIYLSMSFAQDHYERVCVNCCKLHQCILGCIQKIVK